MEYRSPLSVVFITIGLLSFVGAQAAGIEGEAPTVPHIEAEKQAGRSDTARGTFGLGLTASFGRTYPSGTVAGTGDQKRRIDTAYSAGARLAYQAWENSTLLCGVEYARKTLAIERTYMGLPSTTTLELSFIQLSAGYRRCAGMLYGEAGLFYALKAGTWTDRRELGSTVTTSHIDKKSAHNEAGVFLGAGLAHSVWTVVSLEAGLRAEISFKNACTAGGDRLRTNSLLLTAGATYSISL